MRNIPFFSSDKFGYFTYAGLIASVIFLISEPRLLSLLGVLGWIAAMVSAYNLRYLLKWLQERYQLGWSED